MKRAIRPASGVPSPETPCMAQYLVKCERPADASGVGAERGILL